MSDLFDQLKSEGPVKKTVLSATKTTSPSKNKNVKVVEQFNTKLQSKPKSDRRESLPSPITVSSALKKTKPKKARSLSPPKYSANAIKSLKVKLERKKIEEFLNRPLEEHANNIRIKQDKIKDTSNKQKPKTTPTKAQQKQFEPSVHQGKSKEQIFNKLNVRSCKVRIRRDNLKKLAKEFKKKYAVKKEGKVKATKRPASESPSLSPPSKKGKLSDGKSKNSFFIKLNTSPSSKMEKKLKNLSKSLFPSSPISSSSSSSSAVAQHNKIKNSKFNTITTPTKFSRSQLIGTFGKRFFNVQVKIERCAHPLMLTFESNDRARRLQAKRDNKSKNLSVSFREQVEIFGGSSESDDSCDEDFCAVPNRNKSKSNTNNSKREPETPVVMPARLKKVENGKVVDDIELDPSLFVDPKVLVASTPFSPGRKKRDHKSFSPLKDESSPSPRKEQLKLANEKIPPSGLRRLNIEEEDDEDDDCEYIVPIELPQRRTSRTSSITSLPLTDPTNEFAEIFQDLEFTETAIRSVCNNIDSTKIGTESSEQNDKPSTVAVENLENGSEDSFQSANDNYPGKNDATNNLPFALRVSQTSPINFEPENKKNDDEPLQHTNGNGYNERNRKDTSNLNSLGDVSMNLFLDDSQTNDDDTNAKSFVDSLISDTINKLSKDIDDSATDKQYNDTT